MLEAKRAEEVAQLMSEFSFYLKELRKIGITEKEQANYSVHASRLGLVEHLAHAAWMCLRGIELITEGQIYKATKWLGYVQGVLFMTNVYTLDELRAHSRPQAKEEIRFGGSSFCIKCGGRHPAGPCPEDLEQSVFCRQSAPIHGRGDSVIGPR